MDEALVIALTHGRSAMTMSDVAEAKMLVELGVTDASIYTPDERDRVATHEAGHATVAYFVGQSRQLDVLSIVKRRDSLGLLQHSDTEERFTQTQRGAATPCSRSPWAVWWPRSTGSTRCRPARPATWLRPRPSAPR